MEVKLVEVPVEELSDPKRKFYWAVNAPDGYDPSRPTFLNNDMIVSPHADNGYYEYYKSLGKVYALVFEVIE